MERKYYDFEKINILGYAFGEGVNKNSRPTLYMLS